MAISDLISKVILEDEFTQTFSKFHKETDAIEGDIKAVENEIRSLERAMRSGGGTPEMEKALKAARNQLKDLKDNLEVSQGGVQRYSASWQHVATSVGVAVGAITGTLAAIDTLTASAVQNQQAMFSVAASAAAANKEFGDSVGTVESWTGFVREASDQLRVFGDKDVAAATSRLVDMSKRLGLNEEQMRTVLLRTGDLAAGKTTLADGAERVTAALRGEAEAAEFLSLSLNETTVRNYAESLGLVFKELTDGEKEQLRYQLFLQQSDALQGRAAKSAETLAGQEEELAKLRQRQIDEIGQSLIPLRQGELELYKKLADANIGLGDIVLGIQSAIVAAYVTTGAVISKTIEALDAGAKVISKSLEALRSGDAASAQAALDAIALQQQKADELLGTIGDIGSVYKDSFNLAKSEFQNALDFEIELGNQTEQNIEQVGRLGDAFARNLGTGGAAQGALKSIGDEFEKLKTRQADLTDTFNNRIARAEFDHGQRLARLQESAQAAVVEAAAQAAQAREKLAAKTADALAGIAQNAAKDRAAAEADLNERSRELSRQRTDLEREAGRDRRRLEKEEAKDRAKIIEDFGDEIVRIEQQTKAEREKINADFEKQFADADPFLRKQLTRNREESLAQLDQQETAEKSAAEERRDNALTELQQRIAEERALLDEDLNLKKERLRQERDDLQRHLEERKAQIEQAAAEAIAAQQARLAEELVKIDEQEQKKIEQAAAAIEREKQNYADKLAAMQFAHGQELSEVQTHLAQLETLNKASLERQLDDLRTFATKRTRVLQSGGSLTSNRLGDTLPGGGGNGAGSKVYNIVVNNQALNNTFASAQKIGRSIFDALNGF